MLLWIFWNFFIYISNFITNQITSCFCCFLNRSFWKSFKCICYRFPTGTPRRIDVDITSIRWKPNFDELLCHFHVLFRLNFAGGKIDVVSTYFFRCHFDGRKIHVVSKYFFRCHFDGRKIHVFSTYFFRYNFDGPKIHVFSTYFFRCNFADQKIHIVSTYFFRCNFDDRKIYVASTFSI